MGNPEFIVNIPSGFSNRDANSLSDTERSFAGSQGWSEEEFRQRKLEVFEKEQRQKERGRELGELVKEILSELGADYRLRSVTRNNDTSTWRLEVQAADTVANVVLPWEIVDRALDFRTRDEFARLRNMVWFGLGRSDLIFEGRG